MRLAQILACSVAWLGCGRVGFDPLDDGRSALACERSAGLVAYWPFDENAGTVAKDLSASHHDARLTGGTVWIAGAIGTGLQFNGQDFAELPVTTAFDFGGGMGSLSISYWLRPISLPIFADIRPFEIAHCAGLAYVFLSVDNAGGVSFGGYDFANGRATTSSLAGVVTLGTWTHVVHVLDRTIAKGTTYINGTQSGPLDDLSMWTSAVDCAVAESASFGGWSSTFNYVGAIDDVRLYERALTGAEALELSQITTSECPW